MATEKWMHLYDICVISVLCLLMGSQSQSQQSQDWSDSCTQAVVGSAHRQTSGLKGHRTVVRVQFQPQNSLASFFVPFCVCTVM